jgi:hypothetical protein
VRFKPQVLLGVLAMATIQFAFAQSIDLILPKTIEAGSQFLVQTTGSGEATFYIIGLGKVVERRVQLGVAIAFPAETLVNAGSYLGILASGSSTESRSFDVLPARKPADMGFLAKPSRLPVGLHDGISGAVYVFDTYRNLILMPTPVSFELSSPSGSVQRRTVVTRNGSAWTGMDSTTQQGIDRFEARVGEISRVRIVGQVPGDPCGLRFSAKESGEKLQLETDPVRDCNGNAIPDGTIVTFTENCNGVESTVDVPVKRGIAEVQMPASAGAVFSVASGVVLGNQIRWGK